MQMVTEMALAKMELGVFTRDQAALWAGGHGARLDALLKRAMACGEIRRLHRNLYCLAERYIRGKINPLDLAQRLCGPSYISLETALSYHGWIPEGVRTITSVSMGRSRAFDTPVGFFSFTRIPQHRFLAAVRRISDERGAVCFLATPLKALADLVYVRRSDWHGAAPVFASLRVEEESLAELTGEMFDEVLTAYSSVRIHRFLVGLREDLKL